MMARLTCDVATNPPLATGTDVTVEGLWHEVTGGSWKTAAGNPTAMIYGMRAGWKELPVDDRVYYVKDVSGLGHLIHESELEWDDEE